MDNSLADINVDLQQIQMEVESFNQSLTSPKLGLQKSNTEKVNDNLQQLGLSKEIAVYKTSAQSKIKMTQPNFTSAGDALETAKSADGSELYQWFKREELKQQEDVPSSTNRPLIRFKESEVSPEIKEDSDSHQNSVKKHTFKKLVSLTMSQKDYYVTDGDKTIADKEEHIERLLQELVLKNRFEGQTESRIEESFQKRKKAFKSLLSAPMDLKLYYRRNTLKVNYDRNMEKASQTSKVKKEDKIYKIYKRAQTINHLRITFQSLKEVYNDPDFNIFKSQVLLMNPAQERWAKLRRALITIIKMRHLQIKKLEQASDIISEIRRFPEKKGSRAFEKKNSKANVHNPIDENRRINKYFSYIAFGGSKGLDRVKYMLDKDPKRHMLTINSPHHMLNQRNYLGMTPLYVACLNGHLDIVQYLIQRGADPYRTSKLPKKVKEKIIVVSARWNHKEITKHLLDKYQWNKKDIQAAIAESAKGSECYTLLKQYSVKNFGKLRTLCCIGGIFK